MRNFLTTLAVAALFSGAALPAYAQLGGLLGGLTDTVDDLVGEVGGTVDDLLDDVGDVVDDVDDTVGGVLDDVGGVLDDVGGVLPGGDGGANPPADYGFLVPGGAGGELSDSLIAQLRQLIEIIRAREWAQYGLANARIGAVDLRRWIPQDDWGDLNTVMVTYAADIMALQQSIMAGNVMPGWTGFRRLPISRVVAFDFEESEGRIVLYFT